MSKGVLRIITALVGAPLVLAATILGGVYFTVLVLVAAAACQFEFYQLGVATGSRILAVFGILAGGFAVGGYVDPLFFGFAGLSIIALVIAFPFAYDGDHALKVLGVLIAGTIYPALFLGALVGIRSSGLDAALHLTVLSVVLVWSSDTFAYYVGKSIGKHQLTPISPKKTWEGSLGGLLGAGAVGAALKIWWTGDLLDWKSLALLVIICGAVGQVGDIFESKLKRAAGVKDSGSLLPGHGGMLDRLDAVIVVAPLVFLTFVFLQRYLG